MEVELSKPKAKNKRQRNRVRAENHTEEQQLIDRIRNLPVVIDEPVIHHDEGWQEPLYEEIEDSSNSQSIKENSTYSEPHQTSVLIEADSEIGPSSNNALEAIQPTSADDQASEIIIEDIESDFQISIESNLSRRPTIKSQASSKLYPTLGRYRTATVNKGEATENIDMNSESFRIQEPIEHQREILGSIAQHAEIKISDSATSTLQSPTAPPMVQSIEPELLTNDQLSQFYANVELEILNDFVGAFVDNEVHPNATEPLFELLSKYMTLSRVADAKYVDLARVSTSLNDAKMRIWQKETRQAHASGHCNCKKPARGKSPYDIYVLHHPVLEEVRELLRKQRCF